MPNATVRLTPPGIRPVFLTTSGNPVKLPRFPAVGLEISDNQWIHTTVIPSADIDNFSFDPVAGTVSGGAASQEKNLDGFTGVGSARMIAVAVRKKTGATAALAGNILTVTVGATLLGAININEDTQAPGWIVMALDAGDTRFALGPESNITAGTIEADNEVYTKVAHGLSDGQKVTLVSLTGGTGLTAGNTYYFHRLTDDTGTLHLTRDAALANSGIQAISLDATNVVLTPHQDVSVAMTSPDPNLEFHFLLVGSDGA